MELYINHEQGRMMIDKTEVWYKGRKVCIRHHPCACMLVDVLHIGLWCDRVREKGQSDIIQQPLVLHKIKP